MEKIIDIPNRLLALRMYLHEAHLRFEDYGVHLLTDRLIESIMSDIDRLKELLANDCPQIAQAETSLAGAAVFLEGLPPAGDDISRLENCLKLETDLIETLNNCIKECKRGGLQNALADICEKRERDIYFIKNILKAAE